MYCFLPRIFRQVTGVQRLYIVTLFVDMMRSYPPRTILLSVVLRSTASQDEHSQYCWPYRTSSTFQLRALEANIIQGPSAVTVGTGRYLIVNAKKNFVKCKLWITEVLFYTLLVTCLQQNDCHFFLYRAGTESTTAFRDQYMKKLLQTTVPLDLHSIYNTLNPNAIQCNIDFAADNLIQ